MMSNKTTNIENDVNAPSQTQKSSTCISLKNVIIFLTLLQYIRSSYQSQAMKANFKLQLKNNASNHSVNPESATAFMEGSHNYKILLYSIESIANLVNQLVYLPGLILIYDPSKDRIHVYSIAPPWLRAHKHCFRCENHIPVVVQALWKFPRLLPSNKPLQIFLSESDFPYVNMESFEEVKNQVSYSSQGNATMSVFCPWLQFGSVPRNSTWFPNVYAFPCLDFIKCLMEWNSFCITNGNKTFQRSADMICNSWKLPQNDVPWETLHPKLFWRGKDYGFLHTLSFKHFENPYLVPEIPFLPRQLLMAMSTNYSWINASWSDQLTWISLDEQKLYKYHIDVGGAGGTSWTGTINKMAMPGVLFHHETPSKDWFYDNLKAWDHYIPIRTDLSDLKLQYEWAENNQEKARGIAENATSFVKNLLSYSNLQKLYERYFGHEGILHNIIDAYTADSFSTLEIIITNYTNQWNFNLHEVVRCSRQWCDIQSRPKKFLRMKMDADQKSRFIRNKSEFGKF
jgi:Glycosyl transferase family 90